MRRSRRSVRSTDDFIEEPLDCAQPPKSTTETRGMMNLVQFVPALLCGLLGVTSACAWSEAQPTLVLQLSQVTHGRLTPEEFTRTRELAFSAAVAMALDQAAVLPVDDTSASTRHSGTDSLSAAASCDGSLRALCVWGSTAEESAFASVLEHVELER